MFTKAMIEQQSPFLNLDARYVSTSEGIWRIFHYRMHGRSPKVQRLAVHLPEQQYITFRDGEDIDFPVHYTWDMSSHKWNPRKTTTTMIGRLYIVQPSEGEKYYLRILLTRVKGATSFDDLKIVNGHACRSFKEACICLGLLQNDGEWDACLHEASRIQTGQQLRQLFMAILLFCQPMKPVTKWKIIKRFSKYATFPRKDGRNVPLLNEDQRAIYDAVMQAIEHAGGCFFVDGPGGTGKTFLYNTLLASVRSCGEIALAVASSGIAALLINGGRTAHSRFKIPIKLNESSTCSISRRSKEARLINTAKLFIWDEAPMVHKFAFEALDRTFRDITEVDKLFGGKVFIFGGDFRQVLPVIPRASRADIVSANLSRSSLWRHMKVMKLAINMRLRQTNNAHENLRQKNFAEFLLKIGDGKYPVIPNTENMIELPSDIVIPGGKLSDLIDFVYPNLVENSSNVNYMVGRAILTPKNDDVEKITDLIMDRFPGEVHTYPSADSVDGNAEQPQLYSPEFLRSLKIPSLPPGELKLKVGIPIMLLRNLNPSEGLCNGTRLICRGLLI